MGPYDQNNGGVNTWYGPQNTTTVPAPALTVYNPTIQNGGISQFMWITNPGIVDMYPVAAGGEMIFIDGENMIVYQKRVDQYGHPMKIRKWQMNEVVDETTEEAKPQAPAINYDELKDFIRSEIDRGVSAKMSSMFTFNNPSAMPPMNQEGNINA